MATKIKFPEWGRTEDGTEVRLCPLEKTDGKPLYCSRDGAFYSRRLIHGEWRFRRAVSFCAAVWKRHVSHGHGTDLDWSETCRLRVRPHQW